MREATAEIRTFTYLLHASQLDQEGLCAMLQRYVPGFERRTGVATELRVTERADELPAELQHALLRITQESLGNIQRHAGATRAAVDLRCIGDSAHLVVCDNGKGMGPGESEQLGERLRLGLGIRGMVVRVRSTVAGTAATAAAVEPRSTWRFRSGRPFWRARGASPTSRARRWERGAVERNGQR